MVVSHVVHYGTLKTPTGNSLHVEGGNDEPFKGDVNRP